jgi:hypothetical protein
VDVFYTRHQVPRATMADGENSDTLVLVKRVSFLRLTYQIRLLCYLATKKGKKLIIKLPKHTKINNSLRKFIKENSKFIKIEKDII